MALPQQYLRATVEEYLTRERTGLERHEYRGGNICRIESENYEHSTINANVTGSLGIQLWGKPCRVLSPNMKVRAARSGLYAYPDATVVCGAATFHDARRDIVTNPTVIIEVLSPSTESYDRTEKFLRYQQLDSLIDYLLIAQNEPRIEHFARHDNGQWLYSIVRDLSANVALSAIDCTLRLSEVYDRIAFPEEVLPPVSGEL